MIGPRNERCEILVTIIREEEQSKNHNIEDSVPCNLLDISSLSSADQVQHEAVIADLDFTEAPNLRKQVVAACTILRARE
jgi:hypothetical protein